MTDTVEDAGFYAMSAENYHSDPAPYPSLSHSIAMVLLDRCPAAAWQQHPRFGGHPKSASKAMDRGTATHMLLTGKGRQLKIIDAENYKKPSTRIERDAARAAGHTPVLEEDFRTAEKMVHYLRQQTLYAFDQKYGHCELAAIVKDEAGPWTRCLIDFYGAYWPGDFIECWDYKTTSGTANPVMLRGHMVRMGWALQAAFQERIISQIKPELAGRLKFRFLVQETAEPYLCSVISPSAQAMFLAHRMVAAAIHIWHDCVSRERWPGYSFSPVEVAPLPYVEAAWMLREHEDELVQLALSDPWLMAKPPPSFKAMETPPSAYPAPSPSPPSASTSSSSSPSALSPSPTPASSPSPPSPSKRKPGRPRMSAVERSRAAEQRRANVEARRAAREAKAAQAAVSILPPLPPPPEAIAGDEIPLEAPPRRLEL